MIRRVIEHPVNEVVQNDGLVMKIRYFQDTDTLYIEFRAADIAETKDLDENTLLDLNSKPLESQVSQTTHQKLCAAERTHSTSFNLVP